MVPLCIRFYLHFNPQIELHFISLNCSKFWKTQVWAHTYNNYIMHSPEQSKPIMNDLLIELAKLRYQRTGKYEVAQQPSTTKSKMPSSIKSESTISKFYTANNAYCECIDKEHGTAKITEHLLCHQWALWDLQDSLVGSCPENFQQDDWYLSIGCWPGVYELPGQEKLRWWLRVVDILLEAPHVE